MELNQKIAEFDKNLQAQVYAQRRVLFGATQRETGNREKECAQRIRDWKQFGFDWEVIGTFEEMLRDKEREVARLLLSDSRSYLAKFCLTAIARRALFDLKQAEASDRLGSHWTSIAGAFERLAHSNLKSLVDIMMTPQDRIKHTSRLLAEIEGLSAERRKLVMARVFERVRIMNTSRTMMEETKAMREQRRRLAYDLGRLRRCTAETLYPRPPPPRFHFGLLEKRPPNAPGVYFVWKDSNIVYVGKSCSIEKRCTDKGHQGIREGDSLSWLLFDDDERHYAELFYIATLRPERNKVKLP